MGCFNSTERRQKKAEEQDVLISRFFAQETHEKIFDSLKTFTSISLKHFQCYATRSEVYDGIIHSLAQKLQQDINTKDEDGYTILDRMIKREMDSKKPQDKWNWNGITFLRREGATSQFDLPPLKPKPKEPESKVPKLSLREQYEAEVLDRVQRTKGSLPKFVRLSMPSWCDDGSTGMVVKTSSGDWQLQRSDWYKNSHWVDVKYNAQSQIWYRGLNELWSADKPGIKNKFISEAFGIS